MDKESFEILIGSLEEVTKRGRDGTAAVKKSVVAPSAGDAKRFGNIKFKARREKKRSRLRVEQE